MKSIIYIFVIMILLLAACQESERISGDKDTVTISLSVASPEHAISGKAAQTTQLSNLFILFYEKNADSTRVPAFFHKVTGVTGTYTQSFTYPQLAEGGLGVDKGSGVLRSKTYDVHVIANIQPGDSEPTLSTTKKDLFALSLNRKSGTQAEGDTDIPFSGKGVLIPYATALKIPLIRTKAKLDISIINGTRSPQWAVTSVKLLNEYLTTPYITVRDSGKQAVARDIVGMDLAPFTIPGSQMPDSSVSYRYLIQENGWADLNLKRPGMPITLEIKTSRSKDGNTFEETYFTSLNPDQAGLLERNHIYSISLMLKIGDIEMITTPLPWDKEEEKEIENKLITPNSYVLKPGGTTVDIPVNNAYIANPTLAGDLSFTPDLVWADVKSASAFGIGADATVSRMEIIGAGTATKLRVTTGTAKGNAMVAIKDPDGVIRWSWHLWVTDYDPNDPATQKSYNGYTLMDRDLGAIYKATDTVPENTQQELDKMRGFLYQWGRKDPITQQTVTTYNATAQTRILFAQPAGTVDKVVSNPSSFYSDNIFPEIKWRPLFNPCPRGWTIPKINAFSGLTFQNKIVKTVPVLNLKYYDWGNAGNFLIGGFGSVVSATGGYTIGHGFIWGSDASNGTNGYNLFYNLGQIINPRAELKIFTFSVRCVKDNK